MRFKYLKDVVIDMLEKEQHSRFLGCLGIQAYLLCPDTPTALIKLNGRPAMKIHCIEDNNLELYFSKIDIPYEIGYDSFIFHESDSIDNLLSKEVAKVAPIAKHIHTHLANYFTEGEILI